MAARITAVVECRRQCVPGRSAGRACWYDESQAETGEVRECTSGRHRYRSTGQRWVREPGPAASGRPTLE